MTTLDGGTPRRRARLGRYALWHLYDYLRDKAVATLFVLSAGILIAWLNVRDVRQDPAASSAGQMDLLLLAPFAQLFSVLTLLGTIFATNGIISDDRKMGYYRFLFAKPASVPRFYAVKFAAHGVGLLLVALAFLGLNALAFRPFFPPTFLPVVALVFLAVGGIGFLLSATWRWDWLSLTGVLLVARVVWARLGEVPGWRWIAYLFPPVDRLDGVHAAVAQGADLPLGDLAWLAVYGLVCFLLGLWVLRRRPLATD